MKCFTACFSAYSHKKPKSLMGVSDKETLLEKRGRGNSEALQLGEYIKQEPDLEEMLNESITEPKVNLLEEQLSCRNERKKVTVDSHVKTFEVILNEEVANGENNGNVKRDLLKASSTETKPDSALITANLARHPANDRYPNCVTEEVDDLGLGDCESDDGIKHFDNDSRSVFVCEESSESLFSISIDLRKQSYGVDLGDNDKEVNSPMPKCAASKEVTSQKEAELGDIDVNNCDSHKEEPKKIEDMTPGIDSVLNPLQNVSRRKADRARSASPLQYEEKENIGVERDHNICLSPVPSLKVLNDSAKGNGNQKRLLEQEVTVDTSLSNWLVLSEVTPKSTANSTHSPRNRKVKTDSGASETGRESKQPSVTSTPRLRRRKTSKTPVVGTVGSYWRHIGQNVDSDSDGSNTRSINLEIEGLKWEFSSTPFCAKLEGTSYSRTSQSQHAADLNNELSICSSGYSKLF